MRKFMKKAGAFFLALAMVVGMIGVMPVTTKAASIAGTHPTLEQLAAQGLSFGNWTGTYSTGSTGTTKALNYNGTLYDGAHSNESITLYGLIGTGEYYGTKRALVTLIDQTAGGTVYKSNTMTEPMHIAVYVGTYYLLSPTSENDLYFDAEGRIYFPQGSDKWYLTYDGDLNGLSKTPGDGIVFVDTRVSLSSVTINGTAKVGQTLTAVVNPSDAAATATYVWKANGNPISGATSSSYQLTAAEQGQTITVEATGTGSYKDTVVSTGTAAVAAAQTKLTTPVGEAHCETDKITKLVAGQSYTVNNGTTTTTVTAASDGSIPLLSTYYGKTLSIIAKGDTTTTLDSDAQSLVINAVPAVPSVGSTDATSNGGNGAITGTAATMEYRLSPSGTWTTCSPTSTSVAAGTYDVRVKATGATPAGTAATVTVKQPAATPAAPSITGKTDTTMTINTVNGQLYQISGTSTWITGDGKAHTFTGLTPNTSYTVSTKIPATTGALESAVATSSDTTKKTATTAVPTGVGATNATTNGGKGAITGTTTAMEYRLTGSNTWTKCTSPSTAVPAGKYDVRIAETSTTEASTLSVPVTVKQPAATPNPTVDYQTEKLIGLTPNAKYTINGVEKTAGTDGTLDISSLITATAGSLSVIAKGDGDLLLDSATKTVAVNARQIAPAKPVVEVNSPTEIKVTNAEVGASYKVVDKDGKDLSPSQVYTAVSTSVTFTDLDPATGYKVVAVKPATTTAAVSPAVTSDLVTTKYATPAGIVDYPNEKITELLPNTTYKITVDDVTKEVTADKDGKIPAGEYFGKTIKIVAKGTGTIPDSEEQELILTARPTAPEKPEVTVNTDTKITIDPTTTTTEYKVVTETGEEVPGQGWITGTGSKIEVTGLEGGTKYKVLARVKGTPTTPPSEPTPGDIVKTKISPADVDTSALVAPVLAVTDTTAEVTNVVSTLEYKLDDGQWVKPDENGKVIFTGLSENTSFKVTTRVAETAAAMPSSETKETTATTLCKLTGTVTGENLPAKIKVIDQITGNVVKEITTDPDGGYEELLPAGNYKVVVTPEGGVGEGLVQEITIDPGDGDENLIMEPGALTSGLITDETGEPIPDAEVSIDMKDGTFKTVTTDKAGRYYIAGIPDGNYKASVYTKDIDGKPVSAVVDLEVTGGDIKTSTGAKLQPGVVVTGGPVTGLDEDKDGHPDPIVDGKVVIKDKATGEEVAVTTTDERGVYVLPSLEPGTYIITVTDPVTGALIDREITIVGTEPADGTGTITDPQIDGSKEILAEKFIKENLTIDKKVITESIPSTYQTILDAEDDWNQLNEEEQKEVNKALTITHKGKTYEELLAAAKTAKDNGEKFVKENLIKDNKTILVAEPTNYQQIIDAKDEWDKLTDVEKQAADDKLKAEGGSKTYEELYADATAAKEAGEKFVSENLIKDKAIIKAATKDNYEQIIGAKGNWDKLTDVEKAAANAKLVANGGKTYEELYADAIAAKTAGEKFVKENLVKSGKIIKAATKDNYQQILDAKDNWDKLTDVEKAAANAKLVANGGKTYEELYADALAMDKAGNCWIKNHLTYNKKTIKTATTDNYKTILAAEASWNKLTADEQAVIDAKLVADGGKTYEELLKAAKAVEADTWIKDHLTYNNATIKEATNDNYQTILNAEASWNALTKAQQTAINNKLTANGGKTYEELLAAAKAIKANLAKLSPKTGETSDMYGWMLMIALLGSVCIVFTKRRKAIK